MQPRELLGQRFQLLFREIFKIEKIVSRTSHCADQFIEFQVNRTGIAVLCALNQKNHQECDDGGAGIDYQLPRIRELKQRASDSPNYHNEDRDEKCPGRSDNFGNASREAVESITQRGLILVI
jgi:hypothetical protein